MIEFIKKFKKNFIEYEGKYKTVDGLINRKGESLKELFERRDRYIEKQIQDLRPIMEILKYLEISDDKNDSIYRLKWDGNVNVGAVITKVDGYNSKLKLYRLKG